MQKYKLSCQTLKMTIFLCLKLYNILLYTARIAYENAYDMRAKLQKYTAVVSTILTYYLPSFQNQDILICQIYSCKNMNLVVKRSKRQ